VEERSRLRAEGDAIHPHGPTEVPQNRGSISANVDRRQNTVPIGRHPNARLIVTTQSILARDQRKLLTIQLYVGHSNRRGGRNARGIVAVVETAAGAAAFPRCDETMCGPMSRQA